MSFWRALRRRRQASSVAVVDKTAMAATPASGEQFNDERLPYTVTEVDGLRQVRHEFTAASGETFIYQSTHPIALTHFYSPRGRNEPIPLYRGEFTLSADDARSYIGQAQFQWSPQPRIAIEGVRTTLPSVEDLAWLAAPPSSGWVMPPSFGLPVTDPPTAALPPQPDEADVEPQDDLAGNPVVQTHTNVVLVGATSGFDRVTFLVPNGWDAMDAAVIGDADKPLRSLVGRIVAVGGDWEVTLDAHVHGDPLERAKMLKEGGGHDITHVGQIRRTDGATFDDGQAFAVMTTLRLCFSLALGRSTPCLLPVGWSHDDAVGARWNGAPVDSFRNTPTWLDATIAAKQLRELISCALDYCATAPRQQVIRRAVQFYVTASFDVDVELSVALPISALQMLAYHRFVVEGTMSASAFEKQYRKTEDEVRALLDDCKVDLSIPVHLQHLAKVSADHSANTGNSPRDALSTLVMMRNAIVHPTDKGADTWDIYQWAEGSRVALHYLAMALLNAIGYKGKMRSTVSAMQHLGAVEPVPWAKP